MQILQTFYERFTKFCRLGTRFMQTSCTWQNWFTSYYYHGDYHYCNC